MKKFPSALYFLIMALVILSLSGCGSGGGRSSVSSETTPEAPKEAGYEVKQVAVLTSPAFEMHKNYIIYTSGTLSDMGTARYYVASVGDTSSQTTLNLGLSQELDANSTLAVVNSSTGAVVFAYNPSGNENEWKTGGNVRVTGGNAMRYRSLTIDGQSTDIQAAVNLEVADSNIIKIKLNKTSATITNPDYVEDYDPEYNDPSEKDEMIAVPSYDYVWHADPSRRYEYYTIGVNGTELEEGYDYTYEADFNDDDVYIARDIRYITSSASFSESNTVIKDGETEYAAYYSDSVASAVEEEEGEEYPGPYIFATLPKSQNSSLSDTKSLMTHSASDAYKNPVLHIRSKGIYLLSGTWTGQISVEADAIIILNGVTVTCTVGPAFVFADPNADFYAYTKEYGETDESTIASDYLNVGQTLLDTLLEKDANIVIVADGTKNSITGSNVYRMLKAEPKSSAEKVDGTDVSDQVKLCKMDGAFYSYVSLAICGGSEGTGVLNITSTSLEGLGSELHMTIEGGKITINSPEDGINVNEDDLSVFTMLGGTLTINSTTGDGIDSNGYVVINGGTLDITAGSQKTGSAGEAGIDAEKEIYISDAATYTWTAASGSSQPTPPDNPPSSPDVSPDVKPETSRDIQPPSSNDKPSISRDILPVPVYEPDDEEQQSSTTSKDIKSNTDTDTKSTDTDTTTDTQTVSDDNTGGNNNSSNNYDFDWDSFWKNWNERSQTQQGSTESSYTYSDADVLKGSVQTERGVTAINIGTGNNVSFIEEDTDTRPRNINSSGNVFRLNRKVNTFSAIAF